MKIETMTLEQRECYKLLERLFGGSHHVPKVKECGTGIRVNTYANLATFDSALLTKLVVLCHDMCIRAEIQPSGPGLLGIALWKRKREGSLYERHPTLEDAVARIRQ